MKKQILLTLLLGVAATSTSVVQAAVRVEVPPAPGIPAYVRTDPIIHDEQWAAIIFYRDPGCVPADFNLLSFYDYPDASGPGAFGCPLTVAGFEIWENGGPPLDLGPLVTNLRGLGDVPVWFVSWPDLQGVIADGELTKADLQSMVGSLQVGHASFFEEIAHPWGNYNVVAHGLLEDGRSFKLEATVHFDARLLAARASSFNISFK